MTTATVTFYDSTDPASVPADCFACASYCDGRVSPDGWRQLTVRFPELAKLQRVMSIGSRAGTVCRAVDVEPGNPLTPDAAAAQILWLVHHGVYLPMLYTMGSLMDACRAALKRTGLGRTQYGLWLADPTGEAPTAAWLVANDLDAMQWGWSSKHQAPAGTDINTALPHVFPTPGRPPAPAVPRGELHALATYNRVNGRFDIHPSPTASELGPARHHRFRGSVDEATGEWHIHRGWLSRK